MSQNTFKVVTEDSNFFDSKSHYFKSYLEARTFFRQIAKNWEHGEDYGSITLIEQYYQGGMLTHERTHYKVWEDEISNFKVRDYSKLDKREGWSCVDSFSSHLTPAL